MLLGMKQDFLQGKISINGIQILNGKMMQPWSAESFQTLIDESIQDEKITSISIENLNCQTEIVNDLLELLTR